jgi:hypothetical protein
VRGGRKVKCETHDAIELYKFKYVFINADRDQLGHVLRGKRRELLYLFDYVGAIFCELTQK